MDERTTEILQRFETSWEQTLQFYEELVAHKEAFGILKPVVQFIIELKAIGYQKYFRLGTSMHFLLISRSVEHGLRVDQKFIRIEHNTHSFYVILRDGHKTYREYTVVSLNDECVMKLLETLKHTLID